MVFEGEDVQCVSPRFRSSGHKSCLRVCESLGRVEWKALGSISGVMVAAEHIPNKAGASYRRWRREYILR